MVRRAVFVRWAALLALTPGGGQVTAVDGDQAPPRVQQSPGGAVGNPSVTLETLRRDVPRRSGGSRFTGLLSDWHLGRGWFENGYVELWTLRLYAMFDGDDNGVLAVFGAPTHPLSVTVFPDGVLHNDAVDSNTAPNDLRGVDYWSNQWDSYVTVNAVLSDGDATRLTPGFDDETGNLAGDFTTDEAAWFVTPNDEQHRARDGRVLIAQLTVPCDSFISGTLNLFLADGTELNGLDFFFHPLELRTDERDLVSGDCNQNCVSDEFDLFFSTFSRDCNGNEIPDECEGLPCLAADLDCNGVVDFSDIVAILAAWGACGVCDEDLDFNGSVEFADLLVVLGAWGECGRGHLVLGK